MRNQLLIACLFLTGCLAPSPASRQMLPAEADIERVDLSAFFEDAEGTFVLWRTGAERLQIHNVERARQRFIPASTFKIANSLIALETGVAAGPDFELAWDPERVSVKSWWPSSWKQDQTLRSALQNSVYWYYQELARRIGPSRMKAYLEQFDYGNRNISGGIDQFWLEGELLISPLEQVDFVRRLYFGELGVSERTTRLVKDMLVLEETPAYRLSGKTGTANLTPPTRELGWLVGYFERGEEVCFYALNMEGEEVWEKWPPRKRKGLVLSLLRRLEVLPTS